jgi:Ni/Co efflux regulator RcnB
MEETMKPIISAVAAFAVLAGTPVLAQPNRDHSQRPNVQPQRPNVQPQRPNNQHAGWAHDRGNQHRWKRGERMGYNDWRSAPVVNYRTYRLRQPPRGYEWRRHGNQFILVAAATGLIASIVAASR